MQGLFLWPALFHYLGVVPQKGPQQYQTDANFGLHHPGVTILDMRFTVLI